MRFGAVWLAGLLLASCAPVETEAPPDELDIDMARRGLIDCTERTDTGYVDGNPFPIVVVTVDGKPAERETANAYYVMQQAAASDGVQIAVVSGFRTQAEQQYLYDCYIHCNCNNCNLAARPGYSNHQSGHALDLNTASSGVLAWLNAHGGAFGFSRTVPSEDWHWEWWGGGPGGGPCVGATCDALPPEGGVIEEDASCFSAFGPNQFWRDVEGEGHAGSLLWTNAFENDAPSNWARWNLDLSAEGDYDVDVYLEPAYAIHSATRYEVRHSGEQSVLTIDQSASSGWTPLGRFAFSAGADQWVAVYDNVAGAVAPDQHIAVDALRVAPAQDAPPVDDPPVDDPPVEMPPLLGAHDVLGPPVKAAEPKPRTPPPEEETPPVVDEEKGGCSCRAGAPVREGAGTPVPLVGLGVLLWLRRRARSGKPSARKGSLTRGSGSP